MTHLEILQSLVLSPSCPKPVLALCSPNIVSLLYEKKRQHPIPVSFNISAVRQVLADAIGMKGGGGKGDNVQQNNISLLIGTIYAQSPW
jgi:mediator of RNA polymerase II transcription subunit 5